MRNPTTLCVHVRRFRALLAALILLQWAGGAQATNGYFAHGYSAAQRAMGGAGTAWSEDALAASSNPANLAFVPERLDINVSLFSPVRSFEAGERGENADTGIVTIVPGRNRSRHELFGIPAVGYSLPLNETMTAGIAMYGNGGMNTDYWGGRAEFAQGVSGFETQCDGSLGGGAPVEGQADNAGLCGNGISSPSVDLAQVFVVPTFAWQIVDNGAIGISPIFALQRFAGRGLRAFAAFSNAPDRVSDNDYNYSRGMGYRIGVTWGDFWGARFGASYQSPIWMSKFDKYAGLFADEGNFDIPSNWNVGVAVALPRDQRLLLDVQHVNYGEVPGVGNPLGPNRFINGCALPRLGGDTSARPECLGSATGPGFGWRAVTTYKLGYQIALDAFRIRGGYSRNRQPIPRSEVLFNILAPGVPQEHYTFGTSYTVGGNWSVDATVTWVKDFSVTGKNPLSNSTASEAELLAEVAAPGSGNTDQAFGPDPDDQDITLEMHQVEFTIGASYRF